MRRITFIILLAFVTNTTYSQTVYTFNGNGNWSDTLNWLNNSVPPSILPNGSQIIIDSNATCYMNVPQTIVPGGILTVLSGANLILMGNLTDYNNSCGIVTDIDSNMYHTIQIGTQCWMRENLKTTHYTDGTPIPVRTSTTEVDYNSDTTAVYYNYNYDTNNAKIYGRLYNWYAVNNPAGICPSDWHIPSYTEWQILTTYLGDSAGGAMKSTDTLWKDSLNLAQPNIGANNNSGFTGLPAGFHYGSSFAAMGSYTYFWSSTGDPGNADAAFFCYLFIGNSYFYSDTVTPITVGASCRCIKN